MATLKPDTTLIARVEMSQRTCIKCGAIWYMSTHFLDRLYENGKVFCCPKGHRQSLRDPLCDQVEKLEGENEILRQHVARLTRNNEYAEAEAETETRPEKPR